MGAPTAVVIGGGPAGLMAAETLALSGAAVDLYDAMPSIGRKLLMAGRGGLNLTHAEPKPDFLARYGPAAPYLAPALDAFDADSLRHWAAGLEIETFIGSSGRVFPVGLKASPLLRAWAQRLAGLGVRFHLRERWVGFAEGGAMLVGPAGSHVVRADAVILALGGASWARLGADGAWAALLAAAGVELAPFRPANCGVRIAWSEPFRSRWAGMPLKTVAAEFGPARARGEAVVTVYGLEGGVIYALGARLRDAALAAADGAEAALSLDLKPDLDEAELARRLAAPRRGASLGNFLRKAAGMPPMAVALLREAGAMPGEAAALARLIKRLTLRLHGAAAPERAISTAGGIRFASLDEDFMLLAKPGWFVAGEMIDWEAPTGGYLLQACLATGRCAGLGAWRFLAARNQSTRTR
jgi:uncharacterized flavoprotein (TIGR03862 family)